MTINTNNMISITEANQNFSRIARMIDENGSAIIMKINAPRYLMIEFNQYEQAEIIPDEDVMAISKRFMIKNREAYEVLAK